MKIEQNSIELQPGKVAVRCRDCRKTFIIDANKPLSEQVRFHVWTAGFRMIRHRTREEYEEQEMDRRAEREVCPVCGVPHGPNPYTGCELEKQEE